MIPLTARSQNVQAAFRVVNRADFVPDGQQPFIDFDTALPIGYGQTNSQPTTVAFMLELLDLHAGQTVLDVGSGSGWTTALLAEIVGASGRVYGVELVSELVGFGQRNLAKYSYEWASIYPAGPVLGLPEKAPFDRILVSAAASDIPSHLADQLSPGGIMVIPILSEVSKLTKVNSFLKKESYPGFAFVPLLDVES